MKNRPSKPTGVTQQLTRIGKSRDRETASEEQCRSWSRKDLQKWKDSALPQGTNLSASHAENPWAQYLSELRREASFHRSSPQSGLTSVPWEDGGAQSEISSGYTGRQLALGKQLHDQHNEFKSCPQGYNLSVVQAHSLQCCPLGQGTYAKVCAGCQDHLHLEASDSVSCILDSGSPSYFSCSIVQL